MRTKQTALLVTVVVVASIFLLPQLNPWSEVRGVYPGEATGGGPPVTDTDKDQIPDVHERTYADAIEAVATDGRTRTVLGLDHRNATDNESDHDLDGLSSLAEFCWPYDLEHCFTEARRGQPGVLDEETGLRSYLDPRAADTDADGLPDGYEVWLCIEEEGELVDGSWICPRFDPINGMDGADDLDEDGFDVDRDGILEEAERYTNAEEYQYGGNESWLPEIDGMRLGLITAQGACSAESDCARDLVNVQCQTHAPRADQSVALVLLFTEDCNLEWSWLGTDPLDNDSDNVEWIGGGIVALQPTGDSIPDGWEVYFGLDPLNGSDNLFDGDSDGWDVDGDGTITADQTRTTLDRGEAFSNLEEYRVFLDDGNWVTAGLKWVPVGVSEALVEVYDQGTTPSILHHDVRKVAADSDHGLIYMGTRLGLTLLEADSENVTNHRLPGGVELQDMLLVRGPVGTGGLLLLATTEGLTTVQLQDDGTILGELPGFSAELGQIDRIAVMETGSANTTVAAIGETIGLLRIEIAADGAIGLPSVGPAPIHALLADLGTPQAIVHTTGAGTPELYIGGTNGLLRAETLDLTELAPTAEFMFNSSTVNNASLRHESGRSAENVRTLVPDGPGEQVTSMWVGTASGVHLLDLDSRQLRFSGYEHTSESNANDIHAILPMQERSTILVGSSYGMWSIAGTYVKGIGEGLQARVPGKVVTLGTLTVDGEQRAFAGIDPGRFANIALVDPGNNDSDFDGIPDGWEFAFGLDPTDPFDALLDTDGDGVNLDPDEDIYLDRLWRNIDEFRYQSLSPNGTNGTNPREVDSDGDGLPDGAEVFGWYYEETRFDCHYLPNLTLTCDQDPLAPDASGRVASEVYLATGGTDGPLDPTATDTDGDGMPDGWEIKHRRWVGLDFNGGNNWSLDPQRPDDAAWDADRDGLSNLCEYQWTVTLEEALAGGLPSHGETSEAAAGWVEADPNTVDSDGDSLPDGWEARYSCQWLTLNVGINPLNGSDAFNNPDGDGYDANHDGVLQPSEQLVNYLEYHLKDRLFLGNVTDLGEPLPGNWTTDIWNETWAGGGAGGPFGAFAAKTQLLGLPDEDKGSADPTSTDSDNDGMPDGWEMFHARWDLLSGAWTLNPLDEGDRVTDQDEDGMSNWEEYNSIQRERSETNPSQTVPQFYIVFALGITTIEEHIPFNIPSIVGSFGHFIQPELSNVSGFTCDPNNPDTDGDGMLDGFELLFTQWNGTDSVWTLNPLVPAGQGSLDGTYDSDDDGLTDIQEYSIAVARPINGAASPRDAVLFSIEAVAHDPSSIALNVQSIILNQGTRASLVFAQVSEWLGDQQNVTPSIFLQSLMAITDPTSDDTDGDNMSDGFEYWFTEWNLNQNRWEMNPLLTGDQDRDSDGDTYDCDQNGIITSNEIYSNLEEYRAREYGKFELRDTLPGGLVGYGDDAIRAMVDDGMTQAQALNALYTTFSLKGLPGNATSVARMALINGLDPNAFNRTLIGISDPTWPDSDLDGMPDGWEFCYSVFNLPDPSTILHWSSNPVSPLDVDYDGDSDGWYDRTGGDVPAPQGDWDEQTFTQQGTQLAPGITAVPFGNLAEYLNGTRPDLNDSDNDSILMIHTPGAGNTTVSYARDWNLSDGREVFKYGSDPNDDDTDHDFLPDWYEYAKGWNETNDNWSSLRSVAVQWFIPTPQSDSQPPRALNFTRNPGSTERPGIDEVWVTFDPTDPADALEDPDNDGEWEWSFDHWEYVPYNNFQEFYVNQSFASAQAARLVPHAWNGSTVPVREWIEFRAVTLGILLDGTSPQNYLKLQRELPDDPRYVWIAQDNDQDFFIIDDTDDLHLSRGDWTSSYGCQVCSNLKRFPSVGAGERPWGWHLVDLDGDNIAEGTDPMHWDTDGDWFTDSFEVASDSFDGQRGDISPLRYENRTT